MKSQTKKALAWWNSTTWAEKLLIKRSHKKLSKRVTFSLKENEIEELYLTREL